MCIQQTAYNRVIYPLYVERKLNLKKSTQCHTKCNNQDLISFDTHRCKLRISNLSYLSTSYLLTSYLQGSHFFLLKIRNSGLPS
jgi:hypothetical protein